MPDLIPGQEFKDEQDSTGKHMADSGRGAGVVRAWRTGVTIKFLYYPHVNNEWYHFIRFNLITLVNALGIITKSNIFIAFFNLGG